MKDINRKLNLQLNSDRTTFLLILIRIGYLTTIWQTYSKTNILSVFQRNFFVLFFVSINKINHHYTNIKNWEKNSEIKEGLVCMYRLFSWRLYNNMYVLFLYPSYNKSLYRCYGLDVLWFSIVKDSICRVLVSSLMYNCLLSFERCPLYNLF